MSLKPMYKWVGGKAKLVPTLREQFRRWRGLGGVGAFDYVEPFLGGGALALALMSDERLAHLTQMRFHLSDVNADLIHVWRQFEYDARVICDALQGWAEAYNEVRVVDREKMYYDMRSRYNASIGRTEPDIDQAFRFIFLNKTCFNGLYRTNAKGEFNVPWNKAESISFDLENLKAVGARLRQNDVEIKCQDWYNAVQFHLSPRQPTFIYCDPPYDVPEDKPGFTAYDNAGFGRIEQRLLAEKMRAAAFEGGCGVMISNADTPLVRHLYPAEAGWKLHEVSRQGTMSSKGTGRARVGELLITSF